MGIQIIGNAGTVVEVDTNRNLYTRYGIPAYATGQGGYTAAGGTAAVVAAALAANTNLMSFRVSGSSTRHIYITRFTLEIHIATVGASAGVAGSIGLQRFTAATPTGGTARTAARKDAANGSASDVTDIRDSNAALTGTAPTWGDLLDNWPVPVSTVGYAAEFVMEDKTDPVVLAANDGIGLRTQVAMAATQTWQYTWNMDWFER